MTSDDFRRRDPDLSPDFSKDESEENFLRAMNDNLAPLERQSYRDVGEGYPSLYVVGVPRSGTTLLYQLLTAHREVGYINNLIAAFWRAPVHGVRLSAKLFGKQRHCSFESRFGRTESVLDPHEFGYFWSEMFRYRDNLVGATDGEIDWTTLRLTITNIAAAFGMPVVFKSFHAGWHAADLSQALPNACFVRVRRNEVDNALSLLKMRREFAGAEEKWASFKPRQYEHLLSGTPCQQVAAQVFYLERELDSQLSSVPPERVLNVDYGSICLDPRGVLKETGKLFSSLECEVESVGEAPLQFDRSDWIPDSERAQQVAVELNRLAEADAVG